MKIVNETYMKCPECGVEASGIDDINKVFGFKIVKGDLVPYSECRDCRKKDSPIERNKRKRKPKDKQWATAASWGKQIHISRTVFDSYLIEMGYLEYDDGTNGGRKGLVVTEKGRNHSATTNAPFHRAILWDFDTYMSVAKLRVSYATIHDTCPKCKAYLDTMPGYNHLDYSHKCKRCGRVCEYWYVNVTHDR